MDKLQMLKAEASASRRLQSLSREPEGSGHTGTQPRRRRNELSMKRAPSLAQQHTHKMPWPFLFCPHPGQILLVYPNAPAQPAQAPT